MPPPLRPGRWQCASVLYPGEVSSLKTAECLSLGQVSHMVNKSALTSHTGSAKTADLLFSDLVLRVCLCLLAPERLRNVGRGVPLSRSILITLLQWLALHDSVNNALGSANVALLFTMPILHFCHLRLQVEGDPNIDNSGTNAFLVSSKLKVKIPHFIFAFYLLFVFRRGVAERGKGTQNTGVDMPCRMLSNLECLNYQF